MRKLAKVFITIVLAATAVFVGCTKDPQNNENNENDVTVDPTLAVVGTPIVSTVTDSSALVACVITSHGGESLTERGVCWSKTTNPQITDSHLAVEGGVGSFVAHVTGLERNTTYYLKTYAVNKVGVAYSQEITFTTEQGRPEISVIEGDGFMYDGMVIEYNSQLKFGFEMSSAKGLGSLNVSKHIVEDGLEYTEELDFVFLGGKTSYTYVHDGRGIGADREIIGSITYVATVYDKYGDSSSASFTVQVNKAAPMIALIEGEGYLADGMVVEEGVDYNLGFRMEASAGLFSIKLLMDETPIAYELLWGETSAVYETSISFDKDKGIVGEHSFTAVVTDNNAITDSLSFTIQVYHETTLETMAFEWSRIGGAPGEGLAEFGLYWNQNSRDIYARIRPLEGVTLMEFDPSAWNSVTTEAEKAALFSESGSVIDEYAKVSATMGDMDYDHVIGTIQDGTMKLIHVLHSRAYTFKGYGVEITGEFK